MSREAFLEARDLLLQLRGDPERASREFTWPELETFNWALDHFDRVADPARIALWVVSDDDSEEKISFGELAARSNRVANLLRETGIGRRDRVLLMLPNRVELWETLLACMKLGAVVVPATPLLLPTDIADRMLRGEVRHVITDPSGKAKVEEALELLAPDLAASIGKILVGAEDPEWRAYTEATDLPSVFVPDGETKATDPLLLYFTSGTTQKPKLVLHTHQSYPVGHLSTMYWIGLEPGDVHWNISSPGWAKHAWSNVFAPWNAEATVLVFDYARMNPKRVLALLERAAVTTLCAPPTVWRMLILEDLASIRPKVREIVAAGEPLNPEIIQRVHDAWGIDIRDGYGQTETTCQIGNPPGAKLKPGSMGRPLPGYEIALLDPDGKPADEGEIALPLDRRPMGLMQGYLDDPELMNQVTQGGFYRTGDVASRDADGYITYVGRADDVFKASDYRISPFELESALLEHPAVAEAAVVPSPDPVRAAIPKAFVTLVPGSEPNGMTAESIFLFAKTRLSPFLRVRRIEFTSAPDGALRVAELPKTISGKIRRVELKRIEAERRANDRRGELEFFEEDFGKG